MVIAESAHKCDSCGWVYRPVEHAGRSIDEQPEGWACDQCQADRDHFQLVVPSTDDVLSPSDEEEAGVPVDLLGRRRVFTDRKEPDVETLHGRYLKKKLDIRPEFQRYDVWTNKKKSLLIESVLLGLPIPIVYFAQEPDETSIVVDGQQRLLALFQFYEGALTLTGLRHATDLEGKRFGQLPDKLQDRITKFQLTVVEILKESDPEIRFDLFERLNTGATQLNDQELRNSVYRGSYNEFLKTLATDTDYRKLLGLKDYHKRMVDVELVLRFMAFHNQTYLKHPDKKTNQFLNDQMKLGKSYTEKELPKHKDAFRQAVGLSTTVLGKEAFKAFKVGTENDHEGMWERRSNKALMDVQLYGFATRKKGEIVKHADAVREMAIVLMSTNEAFVDLISHTISEKKRVERRFKTWLDALDGVLKGAEQGPRNFDGKVRDDLFAKNPRCARCGQKIQLLDDAAVDHAEPYSKGGKTKRANAQLMHRYCNAVKGARPK